MRVTQTRPRLNVPSERREHHQPQVIGRLIQEKISLPPPRLEPGSPALETSVLTTPPLARSVRELIPENGRLVREGSLAKSFSSIRGNPENTGVGRGAELAGRCVEMK
jgi:hypothetical protein